MVVVGVALLFTGVLQIARRGPGARDRDDMEVRDGLLAGVSQGLAVIPGLSRSGVTVAALLWRGFDRREALVLSFLMSVPASLAAAAFAVLDGAFVVSAEALVGAAVAFGTGLVTIKVLVAVAERVNFAAIRADSRRCHHPPAPSGSCWRRCWPLPWVPARPLA